jgi:D-xylono/L-arabinono-1,4-lactonase
MKADLAVDCRCRLGEGALWNHETLNLHWVESEDGRLFTWDLHSEPTSQKVSGKLGGYVFCRDGSFLLFCEDGLIRRLHRGEVKEFARLEGEEGGRFNDVSATPSGEVLCGTMPIGDRLGALYKLDAQGALTLLLDGVGCSNGIGFTPDQSSLYFTDTGPRTIVKSPAEGPFAPQPFLTIDGPGYPDGLCVDAEGGIWSARWGGWCVVRHHPNGSEDFRVEVDSPQVTSCAFGGPDLDTLYITTASFEGPAHAGGLFVVKPGFRGQREPFASI